MEQLIEIIILCTRCNEEHFRASGYTYFSQNMSDYEGLRCPKCDKPTQWVLIARISEQQAKAS